MANGEEKRHVRHWRGSSADPQDNSAEARRKRDIAQYGWQAVWVGRTHGDPPEQPVWCYTIGLHAATGGPEFIIVGLPADLSHGILSVLADRVKAGEQFIAGRFYDQVLQGFPVYVGVVALEHYAEYVQQAINHYGGQPDFPLLQVVWPDTGGNYPWQTDAEHGLAHAQLLLCAPPAEDSAAPT